MSVASVGSDTGGSVRIPSAFCGLTGFKPTVGRIPTQGALPLSFTLDSIGPLAASVTCCAILDAIMAGQAYAVPAAPAMKYLRFAVPSSQVLDGADDHVRASFRHALDTIRRGGSLVDEIDMPEFEQMASVNPKGTLICAEAFAWHRSLLASHAQDYDPRVASRISQGENINAADYINVLKARPAWIAAVEARLAPYNALLMPTVPITAPAIDDLRASEDAYFAANALI